jgi:hypothetical protein
MKIAQISRRSNKLFSRSRLKIQFNQLSMNTRYIFALKLSHLNHSRLNGLTLTRTPLDSHFGYGTRKACTIVTSDTSVSKSSKSKDVKTVANVI